MMTRVWRYALAALVFGCSGSRPIADADHDVQFVQIFAHFGALDELDTFNGTYQKDLIPGVAKTTMWLTTREQEIILTNLEQTRFFSFPDFLDSPPGMTQAPELGAQSIRIKYKGQDKTVTWGDPIDSQSKYKYYVESLRFLLNSIIFSKPEYKALPPRKGGYQ